MLKKFPKRVGKLNFCQALKEMLNGKKLRRLLWQDDQYYVFLKDGRVTLHKKDGVNYHWIISEEDIMGKDYLILNK